MDFLDILGIYVKMLKKTNNTLATAMEALLILIREDWDAKCSQLMEENKELKAHIDNLESCGSPRG